MYTGHIQQNAPLQEMLYYCVQFELTCILVSIIIELPELYILLQTFFPTSASKVDDYVGIKFFWGQLKLE